MVESVWCTSPDGTRYDILDPAFDPASLDPRQFDPSVPDPVGVVAPHLPRPPKWLVIGGLGDIPEAQGAVRRWPGLRCVGIDPDMRAIEWQARNGWPAGQTLICSALSARVGKSLIRMSSLNCPSMHPDALLGGDWNGLTETRTMTLDNYDDHVGGMADVLLWLDVEGYEYMALAGAHGLLDSGRVLAVNREVRFREARERALVDALLRRYDFTHRLTWGRQWWGHDELWVL